MKRRHFLPALTGGLAVGPSFAFQVEQSKMKITSVRLVKTRPRRPLPSYTPASDAWSAGGVEVASPMSIYPKYKPMRSLFMPDAGRVPSFTVEVTTDRGVKGYGEGGPGGGTIVEEHFVKLLIGEDPFDVERIWDILWRSTESYGRTGITMHAISGVDLAIWDVIGKALNQPVYKLIGGATKERIPAYCTGNDIEQHIQFGFKRLKVAIPKGPADGREGMKVNEALVRRTRDLLGPEGDIMLDCWMSWTERYAIEMAEMLAPYRIYWMEECLQPPDELDEIRKRICAVVTSFARSCAENTRRSLRTRRLSGKDRGCLAVSSSVLKTPGCRAARSIRRTRSAFRLTAWSEPDFAALSRKGRAVWADGRSESFAFYDPPRQRRRVKRTAAILVRVQPGSRRIQHGRSGSHIRCGLRWAEVYARLRDDDRPRRR